MTDIRQMQLGQVVDFCIAYNERQKNIEEQQKTEGKHGKRRKATQAEIDAYFG